MDREHNRTLRIDGTVADTAEVTGNTLVADEASVTGRARVHGCFDSRYGYAVRIRNHAKVSDYARVRSSNTFLYGHAEISGHAGVSGDVQMGDDAVITGNARVYGVENYIYGNARIEDYVSIGSNVLVSGDSLLSGHFHITDATIRGNAEIFEHQHFLTLRYFEGQVTLEIQRPFAAKLLSCNYFHISSLVKFVFIQRSPRIRPTSSKPRTLSSTSIAIQ